MRLIHGGVLKFGLYWRIFSCDPNWNNKILKIINRLINIKKIFNLSLIRFSFIKEKDNAKETIKKKEANIGAENKKKIPIFRLINPKL